MDAFKAGEIERMRLGGNSRWRDFFEKHADTQMLGLTWEDATIAERYSGEVGEEWKERLTASVEGREYVPTDKKETPAEKTPAAAAAVNPAVRNISRTGTPLSGTTATSRTASPSRGAAAAGGAGGPGKVKVDDKYFARLGADNASRPVDLPPSQGGKYAGFGSSPAPAARDSSGGALPGFDDLQRDPVAALSKGFGWFTSTVTKTAKTVNEGYIQPTAKQVRSYLVLLLCAGFGLGMRRGRGWPVGWGIGEPSGLEDVGGHG